MSLFANPFFLSFFSLSDIVIVVDGLGDKIPERYMRPLHLNTGQKEIKRRKLELEKPEDHTTG